MPTPMAPPADKWNVVIKLKHENTIRRIVGPFADHNTSKIRAKIVELFNFKPDADFYLTYTEKDGTVVVLEKDVQLHYAVVCQRLNPLRLNVTLRTTTVTTTIVINGQLQENDMSTLRAKIVNLCDLNPDSDFFLTYTDEDGEVVMLEDNEELRDVIAQHLHPLKMTVMVRNGAKSKASSFTAKLGTGFHDMPSIFEGTGTSRRDRPMNTLLAYANCLDCPRKKANKKPVAASGSTSYQYPELDFQKFSMPFRPSPFQGNSNLPPHLNIGKSDATPSMRMHPFKDQAASLRQISVGSSICGQLLGNIPSSGDRLYRQFIPSPMDQLDRDFFGSSSSSSSYGQFPRNTPSPMDQLDRDYFGSSSSSSYGQFPGNTPSPMDQLDGDYFGNSSYGQFPGNILSPMDLLCQGAHDPVPFNHPEMSFMPPMFRSCKVNPPWVPNAGAPCYTCGMFPIIGPIIKKANGYSCSSCTSRAGNDSHHTGIIGPDNNRIFQTGEKCVPAEATVTSAGTKLTKPAPAAVAPPSVRSVDDAPPSALSVDNAPMSVPSSDDTHSSAPSVNNTPMSVPPPVDDAPTSVLFMDDAPPSVPMVEDSAPSVPSVDDAPPPVSFTDGGNEMECPDNDWVLLCDELEEMEIS